MTMKKYFYYFHLFFILFFYKSTIYSQDKYINFDQSEELKKEILDYRNHEILPVIYQQRVKLDAELNDQAKKDVTYLRNFLAKFRKNEIKTTSCNQIKGLNAIKQIFRNHPDELEIGVRLVENYHDNVLKLNDQIKFDFSKWELEKQKIYKKYGVAYNPHIPKKSFWKVLGFILLDPENQTNRNIIIKENLSNNSISPSKLFPNPANDIQTIQFFVVDNDNIKIELYNNYGKLIKTCYNNFIDKGYQSLLIDMKNIPSGDYYYQIQQGQKIETLRTSIIKN
mgnify:CR=1 FL=1